jgi:hypothetical protein
MIYHFIDTFLVFFLLYGSVRSAFFIYKYFYLFIQEPYINPLILMPDLNDKTIYANSEKNTNDSSTLASTIIPSFNAPTIPDFQFKYLPKYKALPNQFNFTPQEIENQLLLYNLYLNQTTEELNINNQKLQQLIEIETCGQFSINQKSSLLPNSLEILLEHFDYEVEEGEEFDESFISKLLFDFYMEMDSLNKNIIELMNTLSNENILMDKAKEFIINKKLDNFIHNYVLETTPLGNVFMRYNNEKKSFEYFSNNTIPYRFLEVIGRKYVITYQCKPIFIDIEEELKRAEDKYDEEKVKEQEKQKLISSTPVNNNTTKDLLVKLKNYNKESNNIPHNLPEAKNRNTSNFVLPAQIKANLPITTTSTDKHLLKENANRYTWEGRLSSFNPLQSVDKKLVNKTLNMSFADFKKQKLQSN